MRLHGVKIIACAECCPNEGDILILASGLTCPHQNKGAQVNDFTSQVDGAIERMASMAVKLKRNEGAQVERFEKCEAVGLKAFCQTDVELFENVAHWVRAEDVEKLLSDGNEFVKVIEHAALVEAEKRIAELEGTITLLEHGKYGRIELHEQLTAAQAKRDALKLQAEALAGAIDDHLEGRNECVNLGAADHLAKALAEYRQTKEQT